MEENYIRKREEEEIENNGRGGRKEAARVNTTEREDVRVYCSLSEQEQL